MPAGFPRESDWAVIGPFGNMDGNGYDAIYEPEREIDLSALYAGKMGEVGWRKADDSQINGKLWFLQVFPSSQNWSVCYAMIYVFSESDRDVCFRIGSDDAIKVWVNEGLVWGSKLDRPLRVDSDMVPASLRAGMNRVLVKVTQGWGGWGLCLRITDRQGRPI